ncbi:MAG: hypothetical protein KOO63_05595 [Bacteroidales bacterium]|nr:hypothetical protein [Candidatus Latescibacterota bacterium]
MTSIREGATKSVVKKVYPKGYDEKQGVFYRPDGKPYTKQSATGTRRKMLKANDGIDTVAVQVGDGLWALKILGDDGPGAQADDTSGQPESNPNPATGHAEQEQLPADNGGEQKQSPTNNGGEQPPQTMRQSAALSSEDDELATAEAELGRVEKRLAVERRLAAARDELARLQEGGDQSTERQHVRREGLPGNRPVRKSLTTRGVLTFPQRPGYRRRCVSDIAGGERIKSFIEDGWNLVADGSKVESDGDASSASQMGSAVSRHVGTDEGGASTRGYLVEIPEAMFLERKAQKQEEINRLEQMLATPPEGLGAAVNLPGAPGTPAGLSVGKQEAEAYR